MKSWKQILLSLLIAAAAIGGWYVYKNENGAVKTAATEGSAPEVRRAGQRRWSSWRRRARKPSTTGSPPSARRVRSAPYP